jgi:anthranilate synthase/indole-3-glycerol phosphate synthase/phosphoribosylanthranilate isomerase
VREARRIKGIKIVSIDWLEDSLLSKHRRPKREGPYLWSKIIRDGKRKAAERRDKSKESVVANIGMSVS